MSPPRSSRPVLTFSALSALFIVSMFYRVSSAVIAPNLTEDLGLNAETLGYLGGAFFYCFALFQIPMGPMLDRIGPRIVIPLSSLIGSAGAFLFAFGQTFTAALFGRILIGVGMSSVLMGSFKVFVLRFPPEKFSTLVGILYAVGTLGNIIAASPLAFLASTIGWRMTFIVVGSITALLAFVVFWAIGDQEKEKAPLSSACTRVGDSPIGQARPGIPCLLADRIPCLFSVRNLCWPSGFMARSISHGYQGILTSSGGECFDLIGYRRNRGGAHRRPAL